MASGANASRCPLTIHVHQNLRQSTQPEWPELGKTLSGMHSCDDGSHCRWIMIQAFSRAMTCRMTKRRLRFSGRPTWSWSGPTPRTGTCWRNRIERSGPRVCRFRISRPSGRPRRRRPCCGACRPGLLSVGTIESSASRMEQISGAGACTALWRITFSC